MNVVKEVKQENPDLKVGMHSIIGTRQYQQDYVYYYSDSGASLAVICDGMGGLEGGERASRAAAQALGQAWDARDRSMSIPDFFRKTAMIMNERVTEIRGRDNKPLHAGTTVVAVAVQAGKLFWLSIGDSKIYIIRNEEMSQVNREHNYRLTLKESLKSGAISQEQYNSEEKKNQAEALISYLGIPHLTLMDINNIPFEMAEGDLILLCSDGLYKSLSDSRIQALIRDNDIDMNIASDRLCAMALRYGSGGQDNTSVLLMQYSPAAR